MNHQEQVLNLLSSRTKFSKQDNKDQVLANLIERTSGCLKDQKTHRVIGCFEDDNLMAIISQSFSVQIPIWIMNYYATENNDIGLGKGYGPYLEECFSMANEEAESKGIFDFWWSVPRMYARNGPRLQQSSPNWVRYEVYTDAVILSNEFPKYEIHKQAYGKILKPHDVFIRHAVLKQEFRSVPLTR
jgi:hypothetical protein